MKYTEVEFKYAAENISLETFTEFCKNRGPERFVMAAGYDHFYDHAKDADTFCRHRIGPDMNQLTFKRKTADNNNFVRTEHNIDLDTKVIPEQVEALCQEFGYRHNVSIFKNCFVYTYSWYTLVYYICYNLDMNELGRFVEIEMKEDHKWASDNQPMAELLVIERTCKALGILPQARIKRSLFEMFRKQKVSAA